MTATKKDFIAVGNILREQNASFDMICAFADHFRSVNESFDYNKFVDYCSKSSSESEK